MLYFLGVDDSEVNPIPIILINISLHLRARYLRAHWGSRQNICRRPPPIYRATYRKPPPPLSLRRGLVTGVKAS